MMTFFRNHAKRILGAAVILTAALILLWLLLPRAPHLVLRDGDTRRSIASFPLEEPGFAISFIHSVNQTLVKEGYAMEGGDIYLETCLYYGFGAGVATQVDPPQTLAYLDDGSMLISGFHRLIPHLSYIVGTVSDHTLWLGEEQISLRELCGRNRTVVFSVEIRPVLWRRAPVRLS